MKFRLRSESTLLHRNKSLVIPTEATVGSEAQGPALLSRVHQYLFRSKRPVTALAFSIPAFSFAFLLCHAQTSPAPPVVTINTPSNNSAYSWNSLVNYSVTVTWNGKSTQYQEIPSNEVLITTTYVPDLSTTSQPASEPTPPGLLTIIRSGCIGCHEFRAKAMGPSFAAIAARFPDNPTSIATLSHYIREGSTGIFGPAAMPPHPAFTAQQLQAVAQWIVKSAANPNVNHYVGTEGTIRMQSPTPPTSNSGIALTAAYTASGQQSPHGESTVILHSK